MDWKVGEELFPWKQWVNCHSTWVLIAVPLKEQSLHSFLFSLLLHCNYIFVKDYWFELHRYHFLRPFFKIGGRVQFFHFCCLEQTKDCIDKMLKITLQRKNLSVHYTCVKYLIFHTRTELIIWKVKAQSSVSSPFLNRWAILIICLWTIHNTQHCPYNPQM